MNLHRSAPHRSANDFRAIEEETFGRRFRRGRETRADHAITRPAPNTLLRMQLRYRGIKPQAAPMACGIQDESLTHSRPHR